jgi:hypothetical protein
LNSKRNSLPLDEGGTGWGWKTDFFTPSGEGGKRDLPMLVISCKDSLAEEFSRTAGIGVRKVVG